jgi:hypothetical protein
VSPGAVLFEAQLVARPRLIQLAAQHILVGGGGTLLCGCFVLRGGGREGGEGKGGGRM